MLSSAFERSPCNTCSNAVVAFSFQDDREVTNVKEKGKIGQMTSLRCRVGAKKHSGHLKCVELDNLCPHIPTYVLFPYPMFYVSGKIQNPLPQVLTYTPA